MYLTHYNLTEKPFQITTDPKFLWLGEKHKEALAMLKYGVLEGRGFLLLTGDVGTGKTTLINALLNDLPDNVLVATVLDPNLKKLEFFTLLARIFGFEEEFTTKIDFLRGFTAFLNQTYASGRKVLLIIDEAQRLPRRLLEEIRLLSNIEQEDTKLVNIFFVGQNEFRRMLAKEECRPIRQRIAMTHQISPLTEDETAQYIKHRLKVAGTEEEVFQPKAIRRVYGYSQGFPRLINIICDHALLTGYVRDKKIIDPAIVKECEKELSMPGETALTEVDGIQPAKKKERRIWKRVPLYAGLLLLGALCGYLFHVTGYEDFLNNVRRYYSRLLGRPANMETTTNKGSRTGLSDFPKTYGKSGGREFYVYRGNSAGHSSYTGNPLGVGTDTSGLAASSSGEKPLRPSGQEANKADTHPSTTRRAAPGSNTEDVAAVERQRPLDPAATKASPPPEPEDGGLSLLHEGDVGSLAKGGRMVIAFNYAAVQPPKDSFPALDELAGAMLNDDTMNIIVKGYTDALGSPTYNKALSEWRASVIKGYLVARGVSRRRIEAVGMGAANPRQPNTSMLGRRANRRVEIELGPID